MRKSVFVLAVIGAACSSVAFAAEVKNVKATTMSDAQMDKVTAGEGIGHAYGQLPGPGWLYNNAPGKNK